LFLGLNLQFSVFNSQFEFREIKSGPGQFKIAMDSIEGFVLAGGASSRMGRDKAALMLEGQTFVSRIAATIAGMVTKVSVVGLKTSLDPSLPIVADVFETWGALGGLHAALSACGAQWALVVACDLPFVSATLLRRLASLREEFDAVVPIQKDGRPQPLCALYRVAACLDTAEKLIESGERRPLALLQSVRARLTPFEELADLDGAESFFDNINTPEDYERALRKGAIKQ
jgi:molybdenum cofactor guanylyltransferase